MNTKKLTLPVPVPVYSETCTRASNLDVPRYIGTVLRLAAVQEATGVSRSTLYLHITQGLWPRPVRIGARAVGWPSEETAAIRTARIAGKTDEEIRQLVLQLIAARKA